MIIAIDFDNTIHDAKHPVEGKRMGPPMPGCKEVLFMLKEKDHKIVVFSVWGDQRQIITDWMNFYDLPFDDITNIKPKADIYLDDKGMTFTTWTQFEKDFVRIVESEESGL